MWNTIVTVLAGLLLAAAGRGGLRWTSLSTAGHELEVASKLDEGSDLRTRMTAKAEARVERYLRAPRPIREAHIDKIAWTITIALGFLLAFALLALVPEAVHSGVTQVGLGGVAGIFINVAQPSVRRLISRSPREETRAQPESPGLKRR